MFVLSGFIASIGVKWNAKNKIILNTLSCTVQNACESHSNRKFTDSVPVCDYILTVNISSVVISDTRGKIEYAYGVYGV